MGTRSWTFLAWVAALACGSDTPTVPSVQEDGATTFDTTLAVDSSAALVTDSARYTVELLESAYRVRIGYRFNNRLGAPVSVPNCRGYLPPYLEMLDDEGAWTLAWTPEAPLCLSAPVTVQPGEVLHDEAEVLAYPAESRALPKLRIEPRSGVFRIRWPVLVTDYDPGGPPWGDPVAVELRVSNPFVLIFP